LAARAFYFVMRQSAEEPQNFTGQLLVAHPNMLDPNFRRSVLFISSHEANEGAIGVIINRPLDKQVSDLLAEPAPGALAGVPVFLGGPVAANQLMFAAFDWEGRDSLSLNQNVDVEEAHELAERNHDAVRAFVGYAGWTAGQLETELRQHAWVLRKPSREALNPERLPRLWFEIMRSLGPWFKMLAAAPDDPSLN
jgi:putative transcriptional regulator